MIQAHHVHLLFQFYNQDFSKAPQFLLLKNGREVKIWTLGVLIAAGVFISRASQLTEPEIP